MKGEKTKTSDHVDPIRSARIIIRTDPQCTDRVGSVFVWFSILSSPTFPKNLYTKGKKEANHISGPVSLYLIINYHGDPLYRIMVGRPRLVNYRVREEPTSSYPAFSTRSTFAGEPTEYVGKVPIL